MLWTYKSKGGWLVIIATNENGRSNGGLATCTIPETLSPKKTYSRRFPRYYLQQRQTIKENTTSCRIAKSRWCPYRARSSRARGPCFRNPLYHPFTLHTVMMSVVEAPSYLHPEEGNPCSAPSPYTANPHPARPFIKKSGIDLPLSPVTPTHPRF